jgi:hypothetical protein
MNEVSDFQEEEPVWFRGQSNSGYVLNSGLFRENQKFEADEEITQDKLLKRYLGKEVVYYNYFKNLGHLYHNEADWSLLYIMQHHKLRTRLLDWSESFAVALFFAWASWKKDNTARVWMLRPNYLNFKLTKSYKYYTLEEPYELVLKKASFPKNSVALYPVRNSQRIVAQQGVFTLQGNTLCPLEEEYDGKLITEGILKSIDIPEKLRPDVEKYLNQSGINYFTIFPDLDGLADHIIDKYGDAIYR